MMLRRLIHAWRTRNLISIGDGKYVTKAFAKELVDMLDTELVEIPVNLGSMSHAERNRILFGDGIE